MSWDGAPRHHLAHGFHHCGKEPAADIFRCRPRLDRSQCWPGMAVCRPLRIERCWDSVLWVLSFSRIADISDRSHAQRVPMVACKQKDRYALSLLDRLGFLWLISAATPLGRSSRSNGNGSERSVFAAQAAKSPFYGPDSAADTAASGVASIGPSRFLVEGTWYYRFEIGTMVTTIVPVKQARDRTQRALTGVFLGETERLSR